MELKEFDEYLVNTLGINEEVLNCVTGINGYNEYTLNDILYYYTGYRDIKQYLENEDKNTYREYYKEEEEEEW
jgi:hypothetical protein